MYQAHDYFAIFLLILSALSQIFPVYYSFRLYGMIKRTPFWTAAWTFFLVSMLVVLLRRGIGALDYTADCKIDWAWIVDKVGFTLVASACWTIFSRKLYSLFGQFLDSSHPSPLPRLRGRRRAEGEG